MWRDPAGIETVQSLFPEWTAYAFAAVTQLGDVWFLALVVLAAYWFGDRERGATWIGIALGAFGTLSALKAVFAAPRPPATLAAPPAGPATVEPLYRLATEVSSAAFPSGHAFDATVVWGLLALGLDWRTRRLRLAIAAAVVAAVSLSRVVLGLHYPVDVLAGAALGGVYLIATRFAVGRAEDRPTGAMVVAIAAGIAAILAGDVADALLVIGAAVGALLTWRAVDVPRKPRIPEPGALRWKLARAVPGGTVGAGIVAAAAALGLAGAVLVAVAVALSWLYPVEAGPIGLVVAAIGAGIAAAAAIAVPGLEGDREGRASGGPPVDADEPSSARRKPRD